MWASRVPHVGEGNLLSVPDTNAAKKKVRARARVKSKNNSMLEDSADLIEIGEGGDDVPNNNQIDSDVRLSTAGNILESIEEEVKDLEDDNAHHETLDRRKKVTNKKIRIRNENTTIENTNNIEETHTGSIISQNEQKLSASFVDKRFRSSQHGNEGFESIDLNHKSNDKLNDTVSSYSVTPNKKIRVKPRPLKQEEVELEFDDKDDTES